MEETRLPLVLMLRGGLGNQLFQYAAGRAYASEFGFDLCVNVSMLSSDGVRSPRTYMLDRFNTRCNVLGGPASLSSGSSFVRGIWDVVRLFSRSGIANYSERSAEYAAWPRFMRATRVKGYFQSYKYFLSRNGEVVQDLTLKCGLDAGYHACSERILGSDAIVVHVRRGDYLTESRYELCSPAYFASGVRYAQRRFSNPRVFVFSDDLDWAAANLRFEVPTEFIGAQGGDAAALDLSLFSKGKALITSNSTFSWWGAWLCRFPDKVVIAPRSWYTDGTSTKDLIPPDWIRL